MADSFFDRFSQEVVPPAPAVEVRATTRQPPAPQPSAISPLALMPREPLGLPLVAWIGSAIYLFMLLLILGSLL